MDAWDAFSSTFKLTNARIAATIKDGGAVVEEGLALEVFEGRHLSWSYGDQEAVCYLAYLLSFHIDNDHVAESGTSVEARIVIEGTAANGRRLEIRGDGWLGYNESSDLEGQFYEPPQILAEDAEEDRYPVEPELMEDFVAALDIPDPKPSPQFERAMVGRLTDEHPGLPGE